MTPLPPFPLHALLDIGWDFNAHVARQFSYHSTTNRNDNDRLASWKSHFENLLSSGNASNDPVSIDPVFVPNPYIRTGKFSETEVNIAIKQVKLGEASGVDNIPIEVSMLPKLKKYLTRFCNATLEGNRPLEWGLSSIVPVPKKGDLTIPDIYQGISRAQTAAQTTTRESASLKLLPRPTMFKILHACGIPETIHAMKIMYKDTSAFALTPEGESSSFSVNNGVLQGDILAPYLFVIILDYTLRTALNVTDGLTLSRRRSSRHPAQYLSDLEYADDISLLADTILDAESLLHKVEACCKSVGLSLNAKKTKYMVINPSPAQLIISSVEKLKLLCSH
ncbi:uncharacterized protein LOC119735043 [Patiria miniata]|uniref:Reverse transcriptase domain-containing protein n=1 Tax=Patiria miniata TaxID=46514 RepID=A0A914AKX9_PATMI|nr:uncharacterized protein LOC119735034 [Patiria miniata]XP_038064655.1 uncharacterized protein LOC119735039 [Patiria miniata]XP_038064658.1 uncharacterized protein LOC119735041 [Patiria miniata]XP_038064660.1 uncharacterized protein LOC119735043 [Patiria miniata]